MHIQTTKLGVLALALTLLSPIVKAEPVQCTNDSENAHYYEVITADEITWEDAKAAASGMFFSPAEGENSIQGHLATITSFLEDECIDELRRAALAPQGTLGKPQIWVGGSQPAGAPKGNDWTWVNNEPAISTPQVMLGTYENWRGGEPSGDGDHLAIGLFNEFTWNDSIPGVGFIGGYVVEYDGSFPADDCNPCNPSGVQETDFSDVVLPPDATITQTLIQTDPTGDPLETVKFADPRVDENGVCSDRRYLDVFRDVGNFDPSMYGKLILPPWLCGSPEFAVLQSDLNFIVQQGVVASRQLPEEIFGLDTFPCEMDAYLGDLQTRGVFVWQPDDRSDVIPHHALELTNACGSRRGLTKGGSFFILNLHVDWGVEFGTNNALVTWRFKAFTLAKFFAAEATLQQARRQGLITRAQYRPLRRQLAKARNQFFFGNYANSRAELDIFLGDVESAGITPSDDNLEGNLLSRGENIRFTIEKIESTVTP